MVARLGWSKPWSSSQRSERTAGPGIAHRARALARSTALSAAGFRFQLRTTDRCARSWVAAPLTAFGLFLAAATVGASPPAEGTFAVAYEYFVTSVALVLLVVVVASVVTLLRGHRRGLEWVVPASIVGLLMAIACPTFGHIPWGLPAFASIGLAAGSTAITVAAATASRGRS